MTLLDQIEGAHQRLLRPSGGCHNCPRRLIDFVPATLPKTNVLFVGEGPGATEVEKGEGFIGRSGQVLRKEATRVGIKVFACTNIVHCRPPNNATPKPKEVSCCLSQFVLDEIRDYSIVVLCGTPALTALFPGAKANRFRGNVAHHPDFPGIKFYHIYHPAFILRRPDLKGQFAQQMERLGRIAAGEPPRTWQIMEGGSDAMWEALGKALEAPLISVDVETPTLKSWEVHSQIRSFALTADGKTVIAVNAEDNCWTAALDRLCAYLEKPEKAVVSNNIGFDLDWLEHEANFDVSATGIYDVGVIWYQAGQYKMPSLKELASRELDGYRYLVYQPGAETDLELLALYNAEDVVFALQLFRKGLRLLKPKTRDLVLRVLGPVSLCLRQMTTTGIYLRQDYRQQQIEDHQARRRTIISAWQAQDPAFIPTLHETGKGLKQYLFDVHKLEPLSHTDSGEPTVDRSVIKEWIRDGATYLQNVLDMREVDKLLSTYLEGYDKHIEPSGRVHSQYPYTWTDTGRTSSRDPNMQNIARARQIRNLFGAPLGSILLEADLNQIEFRIMVCRAHDETGIAAYSRGEDAHTLTAKNFAPNPTAEQRTHAKPINFALLYGGNWENVQRQARNEYGLEWSKIKCQGFTEVFFNTYKRLPAFHQECKEQLILNRGWFESVLGHIFHYRDWDNTSTGKRDHAFRSALNSEAQGPAAQIMFLIMVHARRLLNEAKLQSVRFVNTVHDSVLIEIPDPKCVPQVVDIMEQAVAIVYAWVKPWFIVPLVMDYKTGAAWGSMEDYEKGVA